MQYSIPHHLRSWRECHVGPLPLRRWRLRLRDALDVIRWRTAAAVMDRIASDEMRLAAFLLGEEFAYGFGQQGGLLGHMREFLLGERIAGGLLDASRSPEPARFWALMQTRQLEHDALAGSLRHRYVGTDALAGVAREAGPPPAPVLTQRDADNTVADIAAYLRRRDGAR